MTCNVTGTARLSSGAVYPNATFEFTLSPRVIVAQASSVVTPVKVTVTSDGSGLVDFDILAGNYEGKETATGIKFDFAVPEDAAADFADCVSAASIVPTDDAVLAAQEARDQAVAAAAVIIYPDSFTTNANPGTTDMTSAILAAAQAADGGGVVRGTGEYYAVSDTVDLSALTRIRFEGVRLYAIGTGWASGDPMFDIVLASDTRVDITFSGCEFEGNHKANGVRIEKAGTVKLDGCVGHGLPLYGVKTTTKAGELVITNCRFEQYSYGETGWDVPANRTAALIDLDTDDFKVLHTNCDLGLHPIRLRENADFGIVVNSHFWNSGYTPVSGQPYSALIEGRNLTFANCVFDDGIVEVDAFALSNPAFPWSNLTFMGCIFLLNGLGDNVNAINFVNADATAVDLNGLVLIGNTASGFATKDDILLFTGNFLSPLRWTGMGNITPNGKGWGGINALSLPEETEVALPDLYFTLQDNLDPTKQARFQLSGLTTGTTRTYLLPDGTNGTLLLNNMNQTITGQTTFSADSNTFGDSAGTSFNMLGNGTTTNGVTKTVAIGTSGLSGSITNVTIGSGVSGATGTLVLNLPPQFPSYTVAGLPAASSHPRGMVYVSNESGGAVMAFSDGTNWRRVTDRAIVS